MKKLFYILTFMLFSTVIFAQNSQNFSFYVEYQNSNVHDAIISPVPMTTPEFYVRSDQLITKIEVIDLLGKTIYVKKIKNFTFEPIRVTLPPCPKGIYFVKITFDDNSFIIKKTIYR